MGNIEKDKEIQLPENLNELKNDSEFLNTYKDLTNRYGDNFDKIECEIIKETRKRGCKEFAGKLNKSVYRVIENRIDKGIFEYRYTEFENLDKNIIRKIANADTQRKFREIAIKLIKKFNILTKKEIEIIEGEFSKAKNNKTIPNFETISNEITKLMESQPKDMGINELVGKVQRQEAVEVESQIGATSIGLQELKESINRNDASSDNTSDKNNYKKTMPYPNNKKDIDDKTGINIIDIAKNFDDKTGTDMIDIAKKIDPTTTGKQISKIAVKKEFEKNAEMREDGGYIPEKLEKKNIDPYFKNMGKLLFESNAYKRNGDSEFVKKEFNRLAANLSGIIKSEKIDRKGQDEILETIKNILQSKDQGKEIPDHKIESEIIDIAKKYDPTVMGRQISEIAHNLDVESLCDNIDYVMLDQRDDSIQDQEKLFKEYGIDIKDYKDTYNIYIYLKTIKEKYDKGEPLNEEEQEFLIKIQKSTSKDPRIFLDILKNIFGDDGKKILECLKSYETKYSKHEEIKHHNKWNPEGHHVERISGNINSINPDSIVQYNNTIHDYVFKNDNGIAYDTTDDEEISPEYKKILYGKLVKQHSSEAAFSKSTEYLDEYGEINYKKIENEKIDEESIKKNYETIKKMINDLANKEFRNKKRIKKINNICTRKCIMSICFSALSKYFDSSNNNGENFANEFEIKDINENIGFDKESGIIKMTGTIGGSNHIGLYYDTKKGELSFDNFIGFNSNVGYIIGKNNGETEKINIKLPTMHDMENQCKKVDKKLIYAVSLNTPQYIRNLSNCLKESLRIGCFQGFIGTDMDVNKQFVKEFNEKNILKQDIIKSIYTKYYDEDSVKKIMNDKLIINKGNTKEQYKLVKLVDNSINNCKNADEVLRFRNLINKFDNILETNPKLIKEDKLLSALFIDNKNDEDDISDQSKQTIQQENPGIGTQKKDKKATYATNYENRNKTKSLNYFIFLDLLSENGHIDLDTFDIALNTIEKEGEQLLDKQTGTIWHNYCKKVEKGELAEIVHIEGDDKSSLANLEKEMENAYDDLKI